MSRIIDPENAGKERGRLVRCVVLAVRELAHQTEPNDTARDSAAFIALALVAISNTIESSVRAWEKRGYWVKADHFRMEWLWAGQYGSLMEKAIRAENWQDVAQVATKVAGKLTAITISQKHRLGTPWTGAFTVLINQKSNISSKRE